MRFTAIAILAQIGFGQQIESQPGKGPAVGTILVAARKSGDADLKQSVVLVVHSGPEGVIGLILNRPVDRFGGPIPLGIRTLVKSAAPPEGGTAILKGVYLVPRKLPDGQNVRALAGYVGWTAQQVKDEIARGLWTVRHGDADLVFDGHPETLWRRLVK
jgi:putative AlgH/UPF0301 family transcriptional regulator